VKGTRISRRAGDVKVNRRLSSLPGKGRKVRVAIFGLVYVRLAQPAGDLDAVPSAMEKGSTSGAKEEEGEVNSPLEPRDNR